MLPSLPLMCIYCQFGLLLIGNALKWIWSTNWISFSLQGQFWVRSLPMKEIRWKSTTCLYFMTAIAWSFPEIMTRKIFPLNAYPRSSQMKFISNHAKTSYGPVFLMICKSLLQKVKDNELGLYTTLSIMVMLDRYIHIPWQFNNKLAIIK